MINKDGVFIGQVCHIEAAEQGGERFNPNTLPEDRRAFANLMLMCYEHHTVTDDVDKYTVSILREIKATHEAKFSDVARVIQTTIADQSLKTQLHAPKSLKRFMGPDCYLTEEQIQETIKEVLWASESVKKLPIRTRQLLSIIIGRLGRKQLRGKNYRYDAGLYLNEVCEACHMSSAKVRSHVNTMQKYRIARLDDNDPEGSGIILYETPKSGWFIWGDLQEFCTKENLPLQAILVDLRFDLLD
jgi:hypothetical protein